jgi:hypothetical protein
MQDTLEQRIARLERVLALKDAYSSVVVSFKKGSKLPEDVKQQVIDELSKACSQLAEHCESETPLQVEPLNFSSEEVKILKDLAKTVIARSVPNTDHVKTIKESEPVTKSELKVSEPEIKRAVVITLDNVQKSLRNRLTPQALVYVKKQNEEGLSVVVDPNSGISFTIPTEDLEFQTEEK